MRVIAALVAAILPALPVPAQAQTYVTVRVGEWTEGADRLVTENRDDLPRGEAFGPFRVVDSRRAALVDATDAASPRQFAAMLDAHPEIATLELIECPGTDDDAANLALGRMIRARGIATYVPASGSVRSGAVELFLAGRERRIDDGAEFAVHAWRDSEGREPGDFAADSPYNRAYVDYYREMGLAHPQAFYDMTNAVPNDEARWLTAQVMRAWLGQPGDGGVAVGAHAAGPTIAYLDLVPSFP